jgi:carboxylesterase type B
MGGHFGAVASMGAETAGMYAIAKFLSSPAYANWLTRAVELSGKQASAASLRSHVNTLARIAQQQRDPQAKALGLAVARAYQNQVSQGALRVLGGNAANPQNRRDKGLPPQSLRALAPPQSGRLLPAPAIGR